MQIEYVYIKNFRNLENFEIRFTEMKTVLIGQNAAGKSNFLEALVLIFKQLDLIDKEPKAEHLFEYTIIYRCFNHKLRISRKKENNRYKYQFEKSTHNKDVFGNEIFAEIKRFRQVRDEYLPKYVFAYYSGLGNSNRLEQHFNEHKEDFAKRSMNATDNVVPKPAKLFYAELIHSQLSLLSFFIDNDPNALEFLRANLGIEKFQSALLTIQKPDWSTAKKMQQTNEYKFFGSTGVVRDLLYYLHDSVAFAPLRDIIKPSVGLWEKKKNKTGNEAVHLYINDFVNIQKYVKNSGWTSFDFFHVLNTANVSHLLLKEGIKIRVKKEHANKILFQDLSEGEQQLLTVLGLMRFTYTEEALFLLDEPDTHLNPLWRWKYMDFIDQIVLAKGKVTNHSIQVIMTSHDPLTIGGLRKEEVRILSKEEKEKIKATIPMEDPKGLGVAGILTSDIFGLPSTLSPDIYKKLEDRKDLERKLQFDETISDPEKTNLQTRINQLNEELDYLGYTRVTKDPLYEKFQLAVLNHPKFKRVNNNRLSPEEVEEQYRLAEEILNKILNEEDTSL